MKKLATIALLTVIPLLAKAETPAQTPPLKDWVISTHDFRAQVKSWSAHEDLFVSYPTRVGGTIDYDPITKVTLHAPSYVEAVRALIARQQLPLVVVEPCKGQVLIVEDVVADHVQQWTCPQYLTGPAQ